MTRTVIIEFESPSASAFCSWDLCRKPQDWLVPKEIRSREQPENNKSCVSSRSFNIDQWMNLRRLKSFRNDVGWCFCVPMSDFYARFHPTFLLPARPMAIKVTFNIAWAENWFIYFQLIDFCATFRKTFFSLYVSFQLDGHKTMATKINQKLFISLF